LSLRLLSGAMPDDDELYAKRLGFWLRMARERAGKSQAGAADHLGLSKNSKSTISDYENGVTVPAIKALRRLAAWYQVPLEVFTNPEPTVEERLDAIVREAGALQHADWEREQAGRPGTEAARDDAPDTRSA
jgi:transcriptional regulator with XRE-family HTH domain